MSESSFPFQGQPGAQAPGAPEPAPGEGNRTKLLALGGVAVVLVLGLLAYFFVFAGGEDAVDEETVAAPAPAAVAPVAPAPSAAPVTAERLSAKSFGRDPFDARIEEPAEEVAAAATAVGTTEFGSTGTTSATTDTGTTDTGTTDTGTTSTGSGTTDPGKDAVATDPTVTTDPETSAPPESTAHTFKVVEVAPDNSTVTVKVDGKEHKNLQAGEVFATYFKVILISGQVNSFQFGEEKFNVIGTKRLTIA